jgi:hypothetical protein
LESIRLVALFTYTLDDIAAHFEKFMHSLLHAAVITAFSNGDSTERNRRERGDGSVRDEIVANQFRKLLN